MAKEEALIAAKQEEVRAPVFGPPVYLPAPDYIPLYIIPARLQVRLDGHFCAVHAVADRLRRVF